eukprot:Skav232254  [mRNA]  locus=scaffold273:148331:150813:- [translate_table: standard]
MFRFNAQVMGFGAGGWMEQILNSFGDIVVNACDSLRLHEECDLLSLRIDKAGTEQFRQIFLLSCALLQVAVVRFFASLPEDRRWATQKGQCFRPLAAPCSTLLQGYKLRASIYDRHKAARAGHGWACGMRSENVKSHGRAVAQNITIFVPLIDLHRQVSIFGLPAAYPGFFESTPAGQEYFKQSDTRLHFIVEKAGCQKSRHTGRLLTLLHAKMSNKKSQAQFQATLIIVDLGQACSEWEFKEDAVPLLNL